MVGVLCGIERRTGDDTFFLLNKNEENKGWAPLQRADKSLFCKQADEFAVVGHG